MPSATGSNITNRLQDLEVRQAPFFIPRDSCPLLEYPLLFEQLKDLLDREVLHRGEVPMPSGKSSEKRKGLGINSQTFFLPA